MIAVPSSGWGGVPALLLFALTALFPVQGASAQEVEISGFAAGEARLFPEAARHAGQKDQHLNPSLILQPELALIWEGDAFQRVVFIPFLRLDAQDGTRSHGDIRELNYLYAGDGWDIRIGIDKVFWGVAESRHLVDIVNQTDLVEDPDGEDKLGQPMVNLGLQTALGDFNAFFMPFFRKRTFPGRAGRLRAALPVSTGTTRYESDAEQWHPDFALRFSGVFGEWDVGLSQFYGTGREPTLSPALEGGRAVLVPRYQIIAQTGLDVQATIDNWLLKLEAIRRSGQGDPFFAVTTGFEYSFYGIIADTGDLGLVGEYHYDGRDGKAPASLYDKDIFIGLRFTLNDEADSSLLIGSLSDLGNGASLLSLEAERRLGDVWKIEIDATAFAFADPDDPAYALRGDHYLQIRLSRYF